MSFIIETTDPPNPSETSAHSDGTIEFDDLQWRIPWRTQLRWFVDLVWTKGWATVWHEGLWWRATNEGSA